LIPSMTATPAGRDLCAPEDVITRHLCGMAILGIRTFITAIGFVIGPIPVLKFMEQLRPRTLASYSNLWRGNHHETYAGVESEGLTNQRIR
jgi:hypothetical protein